MQHLGLVIAAPWAAYTLVGSAILKVLILQAAGAPPAIHCTVGTRAHETLYIPEVAAGTIDRADLARCAVSPKQRLPRVLVAYHLGLRHEQAICMSCLSSHTKVTPAAASNRCVWCRVSNCCCQQQVCSAQCKKLGCLIGVCTARQPEIMSGRGSKAAQAHKALSKGDAITHMTEGLHL